MGETLQDHAMRMPMVLHISADFPDPFDPDKTPVIKSLVEFTCGSIRSEAISINRRSPDRSAFVSRVLHHPFRPALPVRTEGFSHGIALEYEAPGKGLFHRAMLEQLGTAIADLCREKQLRPDLIIGHKLSIEGIAAAEAARILGVPYALSIQGDTDTKVLAARPDLTGMFRRIFHEAAIVFPFAPWALHAVEMRLGQRAGATQILPCPTDLDQPLEPIVTGGDFVSVFHLRNHRRKNLRGMADAMRLLKGSGSAPPLEIIGDGAPETLTQCKKLTGDIPEMRFAGALDREALRARLNRAVAMVLPSLRESFGLVFVEALFAGTPIIYPRGAAIDGFFEGMRFAIAVDARDPASIAEAISFARENEHELKAALARWQRSEHARSFQRAAIAEAFESAIKRAI